MEIGPALIFVPDIVTSASFMAASECGAEQNLITWYTHAVLRPDLLARRVWHAAGLAGYCEKVCGGLVDEEIAGFSSPFRRD
jgi:hypothetical protein